MGILKLNTIVSIFLISALLSVVFFTLLYFLTKKNKSIFFIMLANVIQLAEAVLLYMAGSDGSKPVIIIINIIAVLMMGFWVSAIFTIFQVNSGFSVVVLLIAVNILAAFAFSFMENSLKSINVTSSFLSGAVLLYGIVKIFGEREKNNKKEINITVSVLGVTALTGIAWGIFRLIGEGEGLLLSESSGLTNIMALVNFSYIWIIELTLLFLTFNNIVLKIEKLTKIDALTKVNSRNNFFVLLGQKLKEIKRGKSMLTVAYLDIDNFKRINDTYGHIEGDEVLKGFAGCISGALRSTDIIGRVGGEEFMLALEVKNKKESMLALKRLQNLVASQKFVSGEVITFSCGQLFINESNCTMSIKNIIRETDKKMYIAKEKGKNTIV